MFDKVYACVFVNQFKADTVISSRKCPACEMSHTVITDSCPVWNVYRCLECDAMWSLSFTCGSDWSTEKSIRFGIDH